jgi:TRAP-type uncharacterized transport system substrate-binding protein
MHHKTKMEGDSKMKRFFSLSSALFLLLAVTSVAQTTIRVAADSSSGTYNKMLGEIIGVCNDNSLNIVPANEGGGGAVGNLDALFNNKADAAFLHSDVYLYNAQSDPSYNKFKTLVAGWPESIHILTLRQSISKKHGTLSFGRQDFNSLVDLNGYTVAAAGGGVLTGRILSGQGGGNFTVIDAGSGTYAIAMLDSGKADAAIFVGAAPLPNIEKLDKSKYKLLPIGESIASHVGNVYRPVKINYPGLTNGPLTTMAPLATILTRQFSTPEKISAQAKLRACVTNNLPRLQDTGSPNWQDVTAGDHGIASIPWLDLPATTTSTASRPTHK